MKRLVTAVGAGAAVLGLFLAGLNVATSDADAQREVSIRVTRPDSGDAVEGPNVEIRMQVTGVELTSRRSGAGAHILLRLDDHPPVKSFTERFTFQGVSTGNHMVRAELRHTDGSAFNPPARAQVRFAVR